MMWLVDENVNEFIYLVFEIDIENGFDDDYCYSQDCWPVRIYLIGSILTSV